jgi:hypothetical protein
VIRPASRLALMGVVLLAAACAGVAEDTITPLPRTPLPVLATPIPVQTASEPPESEPPAVPDPESAYQQLLVTIPSRIRPSCQRVVHTQAAEPEEGELAGATCTLPAGWSADIVTYTQFEGPASMYAAFDRRFERAADLGETNGPGCGDGPGPAQDWDLGRRFCFTSGTDAQVYWTHDLLYVSGHATRNDGDYRRLEAFWRTAGPILP